MNYEKLSVYYVFEMYCFKHLGAEWLGENALQMIYIIITIIAPKLYQPKPCPLSEPNDVGVSLPFALMSAGLTG